MDLGIDREASAPNSEVNVDVLKDESSNIDLVVEMSSNGEINEELGTANQVLTRVELDLARAAEKLVNLSILMMHVATKESDFEAFATDKSIDSPLEVLEFDLLSGFLEGEVIEMKKYLSALRENIVAVDEAISLYKHLGEAVIAIKEKLRDSDKSLKQTEEQVSEIIEQSAKVQKVLSYLCRKGLEDADEGSHLPEVDHAKIDMRSVEQQRHILGLLEKSLAKEMDLEQRLSESQQMEEEAKCRLLVMQQELFFIEEEAIGFCERWFEKENAAAILMGTSKELLGRLQILQFNLNGSMQREAQLTKKFQEFESKQNALKEKLSEANRRAEIEEAKSGKVEELEKQLQESNIKLQHAASYAEASQEKENMLYSTIQDMEYVIDDLKLRVSKAESQAVTAEARCIRLSETNTDLIEEVRFLRGKLESTEASLNRTKETEVSIAKDISFRTKAIRDLLMQLAIERERLHKQIAFLTLENKTLSLKLQHKAMDPPVSTHQSKERVDPEQEVSHMESTITEPSETQKSEFTYEMGARDIPPNDDTVRRIDAAVLNWKHVLVAVLVLLISAAAYTLHPQLSSLREHFLM